MNPFRLSSENRIDGGKASIFWQSSIAWQLDFSSPFSAKK
jgi:hypothetical protein